MINLFRNTSPLNIFFLIVIAFILRLGIFYQLPDQLDVDFEELFHKLLLNYPADGILSPVNSVFVAMLCVLVQAILFNHVINQYNLLGKPTFLPALMYVTISALLLPFLVFSPALLCNFFTIWMVSKFLSIYNKAEVIDTMFDIGMIIAAGTIIYFPFIAMLPLLWISLIIFRPFYWREWLSGIVGFTTIYLLLAVFYFWNDSLDKFYHIWITLANRFPSGIKINLYDYIVLIPVLIIFILSAVSIRINFFRSFVQIRKSMQLLFFLFLLAMVSFYLKAEFTIYHFLLGVVPASVFMSYYFLNAKKKWFYETLYLTLVGFIIYFQFF